MPSRTLTQRLVEGFKPSQRQQELWDRALPGFGCRISPRGRKTWMMMYRYRGRQRRLTLGTLHQGMTLADARTAARTALLQVGRGVDPAAMKRDDRHVDTVAALGADYLERHAKPRKRSWKVDDWRLRKEILPHWRYRDVKDIRRRDVRGLVEAIAQRGAPIHANRTLALIRKMFAFAVDREWVDANPASRIAQPGIERQRDRVLSDEEIRRFWTALDREPPDMAAAFRLRLLTAQRGGEVINMRWSDIDLDGAMWTVPGEHSKNGLSHRVPLTQPALKILRGLRGKEATRVLAGVVRNKTERAEATKRIGLPDFRGHDLRRTAATRMSSVGVPRVVVGKILNHAEPGVTAIYDRHGYDAEKRTALEAWARTLDGILAPKKRTGAAVVPINQR